MSVGEACNREVVIVEREMPVPEAARLMRRFHVGNVVVADRQGEERVPAGILTDRDIVVELIAEGADLDNLSVGDVMSFELLIAHEGDDLHETIKRMRSRGVRRVPVVNAGGGLVGILALDDVVELVAEQLTDLVRLVANEQVRERERRV